MSRPDQHRDDLGEERVELGTQASSQRHPPHVTENDENAPVREDKAAAGDAPVLPANASGRDKVTAEEQSQPTDDESMYDNRPSTNKDQHAG